MTFGDPLSAPCATCVSPARRISSIHPRSGASPDWWTPECSTRTSHRARRCLRRWPARGCDPQEVVVHYPDQFQVISLSEIAHFLPCLLRIQRVPTPPVDRIVGSLAAV